MATTELKYFFGIKIELFISFYRLTSVLLKSKQWHFTANRHIDYQFLLLFLKGRFYRGLICSIKIAVDQL